MITTKSEPDLIKEQPKNKLKPKPIPVKEKIMHGIYLMKPYGELFARNEINCFIKPIRININNEYLYVCSGKYVYGIVKINDVIRISSQELQKTYSNHRVSIRSRNVWWGRRKRIYRYSFEPVQIFKEPLEYNFVNSSVHFLEKVQLKHLG